MKSPKSYFALVSNTTIALNLIVGLGAIFLVERIVPAIDQILQENAFSVAATMAMQTSLHAQDEDDFWAAYADAKSNVTLHREEQVMQEVEALGQTFWRGNSEVKLALVEKIARLSEINLAAMDARDQEARFLGLAGAWALGFLVTVSIIVQLIARRRVIERLMDPASDFVEVLVDYKNGNLLRRFTNVKAAEELKTGGELLNKVLDRDMGRRWE